MLEAKTIKDLLHEMQLKGQKSVEVTKHEFQSIRTGRASIALVEGLQVEYYNTPTPLKGLATITTPDPRTIVIQPWDPSVIGEIEKAIQKSELGLVPNNDGKVVRIQIPPLTEERRLELAKVVRKVAEEGRVAIRNVRHDANELAKKLEKEGTASKDDAFKTQKEVQRLTDKYIALIDEALGHKEAEIKSI